MKFYTLIEGLVSLVWLWL